MSHAGHTAPPVRAPLVSIVMPSYNQAAYLEEALDSVLSQSYRQLELIVADGGSTDGTLDILKRCQSRDARIRYISEPDDGPADALNKAMRRVRGTLIGWLNSDDRYCPDALERAVRAFSRHPEWMMLYGQGEHIDETGQVLGTYPTRPANTNIRAFADGCFICQPTVFLKRIAVVLLGELDTGLKTAFDFDYWLRAFRLLTERIGFVDVILAQSRLHDGCITRSQRRRIALEGMQVVARHLGTAPSHWLLTYIDEVTNGCTDLGREEDVTSHLLATLDDARDWLSGPACERIATAIHQHPIVATAPALM